jgi:hypothetical protein
MNLRELLTSMFVIFSPSRDPASAEALTHGESSLAVKRPDVEAQHALALSPPASTPCAISLPPLLKLD